MNFGVVLIAVGGFLLGGAYSVARLENEGARKSAQPAVAGVLVLLALYLIVTGILRVAAE